VITIWALFQKPKKKGLVEIETILQINSNDDTSKEGISHIQNNYEKGSRN